MLPEQYIAIQREIVKIIPSVLTIHVQDLKATRKEIGSLEQDIKRLFFITAV